jgi:hypothetical protein
MFRRVLLAAALSATFVAVASAETLHYTVHLNGRREVPKTDSKGTGKLDATYDTNTKVFDYTLTFEGLTGPATAAHIHGPATRKQNAGVVAPLGEKNPTSPITGSVTLTAEQAKYLEDSKLYVNVHTAAHPAGEIRGQIVAEHHRKRAHPAAAEAPAPAAAPAAAPPAATAPTAPAK